MRGKPHLLRGADGSRAHAHPQAVCATLNETPGLPPCNHIAADDLQLWVRLLQVGQHVQLVGRVACMCTDGLSVFNLSRGRTCAGTGNATASGICCSEMQFAHRMPLALLPLEEIATDSQANTTPEGVLVLTLLSQQVAPETEQDTSSSF